MVQEVISFLTEIGERIGIYLKKQHQLSQPVRLIYTDESSFSSCLITPQGSTFTINDIQEKQPHFLSKLYNGTTNMKERNCDWWKLCFYYNGKHFVTDDYYTKLPITEDSHDTIGAFLQKQEELIHPFSKYQGEVLFVIGRYSVAFPFLYQLQAKYKCTLHNTQEAFVTSLGASTAKIIYVPATIQCLQTMTEWGVTVNELIPGGHSIEENCLAPTCCCGNNKQYILLKMWLETTKLQEFHLCTEYSNAPIQKLILWKH